MTREDAKILMEKRKFSLYSSGGDKIVFDFVHEDLPIHCDINIEKETFHFIYVTRNYNKLSSGELSPFTNDKHFDLWFNKFSRDVMALEIQ